jgi:hypothetical protein
MMRPEELVFSAPGLGVYGASFLEGRGDVENRRASDR